MLRKTGKKGGLGNFTPSQQIQKSQVGKCITVRVYNRETSSWIEIQSVYNETQTMLSYSVPLRMKKPKTDHKLLKDSLDTNKNKMY